MNRIREMREAKRMTQKALAQAAGITGPYLHDIEVGNRRGALTTLDRIAAALDTTTDVLMGGNAHDQQTAQTA